MKKSFSEKMSEFARDRGFVMNETDEKWVFTKNELQISLKKSHSENADARRAEKVLNEGMCDLPSAGFYGTSSGHPYLEYKILPLVHNLDQKDKKKEEKGFVLQVGSYVGGKDSKGDRYNGKIQKFIRDIDNNIEGVVILAVELGSFVELKPETVALSSPYPNDRKKNVGGTPFGLLGSYIGGFGK